MNVPGLYKKLDLIFNLPMELVKNMMKTALIGGYGYIKLTDDTQENNSLIGGYGHI
jgi:hypothetical protein